MKKPLILIVEDDASVRNLLEITFREYEFDSIASSNKQNAYRLFLSNNPDLIIVDLGLPDGDGKDFIKELREISKVSIIVLSARHDENEIITALDFGADDYITKPFSLRELVARIRTNLRRHMISEHQTNSFYSGDFEVDFMSKSIQFKNRHLKLTPIEYELLKYFIVNSNRTLTHRQILKEVWGIGYQNEMQYLRTYVNSLRKKIENNSTRPNYIKTESGIGYRFCCEENKDGL
jgi:two-component system KDP operon response regulator KdpE